MPLQDITGLTGKRCHGTRSDLVLMGDYIQVLALPGQSCHMHEPQCPQLQSEETGTDDLPIITLSF